jgi:hypothetical protein
VVILFRSLHFCFVYNRQPTNTTSDFESKEVIEKEGFYREAAMPKRSRDGEQTPSKEESSSVSTVSPIADPLAGRKLSKKLLKIVKKGGI